MTISYIIPSCNRPTLSRAIDSIEMRDGDEICVEFDVPKSGKWGNPQRNKAIARATGDYLAFMDDDDRYLPGYRDTFEKVIKENPGKPVLFRQRYPNKDVIWKTKEVLPGNVSTVMMLVPNKPEMLYEWEGGRNMADFIFINRWKWNEEDIVWREEIIAELGNNDGKAIPHD